MVWSNEFESHLRSAGALRQLRVERGGLGEAHSIETRLGAAKFARGQDQHQPQLCEL
jgi:hypothetical protein